MEQKHALQSLWEPAQDFSFQNSIHQDLHLSRDMAQLEQRLCDYIGATHCVSVDSATTAMLMALKTAGIGNGDAVLCTNFSYFAIADIVSLAGAVPMFVDINPNTLSIDPFCLEYVIGKCRRNYLPIPKALIAVDLFGLPCQYDALEDICQKYDILLIEDMAQSFGATYKGKKAGSFGRFAVASFFPARPLDELGEGGAVFCHSQQDARHLKALRRTLHRSGRQAQGSHLDTIQASVVSEKLENYDLELECRRELAERYRRRLLGRVKLQQIGEDCESAYTQFVISLKNASIRSDLIEQLAANHIPTAVFTPSPIVSESTHSRLDKVALINSQAVAQKILTIPMHPYLSGRVVDYICDRILEALETSVYSVEPEHQEGIDVKKEGITQTTEA